MAYLRQKVRFIGFTIIPKKLSITYFGITLVLAWWIDAIFSKRDSVHITALHSGRIFICIFMKHFKTHQLALAATLLHKGFHLSGVERDSRQAEFVFDDSKELRETVDKYWKNDLLCPAQSLLTSFRQAKHILYDGHI